MVKIAGDTIDEFVDNGHAKFGGKGMGETAAHPIYDFGNFKGGKLMKVVFTCPVDIEFAEPGSGKPDDANKKAIKQMADMAEEHEKKHKAGYEKAFKDFGAKKVADDLMEQSFGSKKEAVDALDKALAKLKKALLDACLDLHKKEGILDFKHNDDGSIDVTMKPAGAAGCK
jgi:hypothetical protein